MKIKIRKNKTILFIGNFLGFLAIIILLSKFFDFKEMGAYSWETIGWSLPIFIILALIFAVWALITYGDKVKDKDKE